MSKTLDEEKGKFYKRFPGKIHMEQLRHITTKEQLDEVVEYHALRFELLQVQYPNLRALEDDDNLTIEQLLPICKKKIDELVTICKEKYTEDFPGIDLDSIDLGDKETMFQKLTERRIEYLLNHCHGWLVNRLIGVDVLETNGDDNEPTHNYPYVLPTLAEGQEPDLDQLVDGLLNMENELLVLLSPKRMKEDWNSGKYKKIVESKDTYKQKCPRAILERQIGYLTQLNIHFIRELEKAIAANEGSEGGGSNRDLRERVAQLQTQLEIKDDRITECETLITERESRITELESNLDAKDFDIAEATETIAKLEDEKDQANHATDPTWLLKQLEEVILGAEKKSINLEAENERLKQEVMAGVNSRIVELEAENQRLKKSLKATKKETAEELAAATVFVNEQDDEIVEATVTVANTEEQAEEALAQAAETIHQQDDELVEATEELANTKDELEWAEETMMMQDEGLKKLNKQLGLESSSDDDDDDDNDDDDDGNDN